MNLEQFRNHVIAQREATRLENLDKILSVANATITKTNERKTK